MRIRREPHELPDALATVSEEKFDNQARSEGISNCSDSTLRRKSLTDDSTVFRSSSSSSLMFLNFRRIIFSQRDSIDSCCFSRRAVFAKDSFSSVRRRVRFFCTRFHSASEIDKSHLRSRRTHSIQRSESSLIRHSTERERQFLQARITSLSLFRSLSVKRRRFREELNDLNIRFECIGTMVSGNRNCGGDLVLGSNLTGIETTRNA